MLPNFIRFEERKSVQIPKVSGKKNHTQDSQPQTGDPKILKNDEKTSIYTKLSKPDNVHKCSKCNSRCTHRF